MILHTQFSFSFIAIITSDFPDCLTNPNPNPKQVNICHLKPIFLENNCEFLCPKLKKTSYFYIKRVDGHIKWNTLIPQIKVNYQQFLHSLKWILKQKKAITFGQTNTNQITSTVKYNDLLTLAKFAVVHKVLTR